MVYDIIFTKLFLVYLRSQTFFGAPSWLYCHEGVPDRFGFSTKKSRRDRLISATCLFSPKPEETVVAWIEKSVNNFGKISLNRFFPFFVFLRVKECTKLRILKKRVWFLLWFWVWEFRKLFGEKFGKFRKFRKFVLKIVLIFVCKEKNNF